MQGQRLAGSWEPKIRKISKIIEKSKILIFFILSLRTKPDLFPALQASKTVFSRVFLSPHCSTRCHVRPADTSQDPESRKPPKS